MIKLNKSRQQVQQENRELRRKLAGIKKGKLENEMKLIIQKNTLLGQLKTKETINGMLRKTVSKLQKNEKQLLEKIESMDKKIVLLTKEMMKQQEEEDMEDFFDDSFDLIDEGTGTGTESIKDKKTPSKKKGPSPNRKKVKKSTSPLESSEKNIDCEKSEIETEILKEVPNSPHVRKVTTPKQVQNRVRGVRKSARKKSSKKKK